MKTAISQFLWVASAYNDPGHPAFQVEVTLTAETMEDVDAIGAKERKQLLNVEQAAAEPFNLDLAVIGDHFSNDMAQRLDKSMADLAAASDRERSLTTERDVLADAVDRLQRQFSDASDVLTSKAQEAADSRAAAGAATEKADGLAQRVAELEAQIAAGPTVEAPAT